MYWTANQVPGLSGKSRKERKALLFQAKRGNRRFNAAYLFLVCTLPIAFVAGKIVDAFAPELVPALLLTALVSAPLYYVVYLVMLNLFVAPKLLKANQ